MVGAGEGAGTGLTRRRPLPACRAEVGPLDLCVARCPAVRGVPCGSTIGDSCPDIGSGLVTVADSAGG